MERIPADGDPASRSALRLRWPVPATAAQHRAVPSGSWAAAASCWHRWSAAWITLPSSAPCGAAAPAGSVTTERMESHALDTSLYKEALIVLGGAAVVI